MFFPIACSGTVSSTERSCAARVARASRLTSTPGRQRAAEELPVGPDGVDVGGRAEVDDDDRPAAAVGTHAVELVRSQRGDDPVGADLPRVVDVQRDAGAHAGADQHDRDLEGVQQLPEGGSSAGTVEQALTPVISASRSSPRQRNRSSSAVARGRGRDPPAADPLLAVEGGEDGLAVADVDGEQRHDAIVSPRT